MSSLWGLATVTKVSRIDTDTLHGYMFQERYENGYETGNICWLDDTISDYQINIRRSLSLMPVEYVCKTGRDFDWSKYGEDMTAQKNIVNAFVMEFDSFRREGRGLYIFSHTKGSGKTMLACCTANEILKKHDITVKFISVPDYIELIKEKDDNSRKTREAIMNADLLILDDVGAQVENKEWITSALFRLIDRRYTNHYPTIFTSNVCIDELKTDDRISDRIYAVSAPIIMPEVSVRKQIADRFTREFLYRVMQQGDTAEGVKDE